MSIILARLGIKNFRCFDDCELEFARISFLVGPNNAGKSTVMQALRLVSLVTTKFRNYRLQEAPDWTGLASDVLGIGPAAKGIDLNRETLFHRYSDPPATIRASFSNGASVTIYVGPTENFFSVIRDADGTRWQVRAQAKHIDLPPVQILPPVGPLEANERVLNDEYVLGSISSHLAPRHFRNTLDLFPDVRTRFREIAEDGWRHLQIQDLERGPENLRLMVRDDDFVAEAGLMGHGLQIWLQTAFFLARTEGDAIVALDEPDIYLHADVQRRLMRRLRAGFSQVIVASHSVEMMAEVETSSIIAVDKTKRKVRPVASSPERQRVVDKLGGVQNLQWARLDSAKRVLYVEGDDLALLSQFHGSLFPKAECPIDAVPCIRLDGWSNWGESIGSAKLLKSVEQGSITCYCFLDRDYRTRETVERALARAAKGGVRLHIWERNELESFLLVPGAIARVIAIHQRKGADVKRTDVQSKLNDLISGRKDYVINQYANSVHEANRQAQPSTCNAFVRAQVGALWHDADSRTRLAPAKEIISALSGWSQAEYGVMLTPPRIAAAMKVGEMADELKDALAAFEKREAFPAPTTLHSAISGVLH